MNELRFTPNRMAEQALARQPAMGAYLKRVADDAAGEIERRAPSWIKRAGARFEGQAAMTGRGYEGRAVVHSSFWHLAEFASGATRSPESPFVRPGVQTVLSKVGGRWKAS